jgi:membrane associated rhomboid family serine protease
MLGLWMFGRHVEPLMGARRFTIYYLTCVSGAGIIQMLFGVLQCGVAYTVGASGGVMGVLLSYALAYPNQTIVLLMPPIPMKAKYFVLLFALASIYFGVSGAASGIAHFAHLGGMLVGFLMLQYWRKPKH